MDGFTRKARRAGFTNQQQSIVNYLSDPNAAQAAEQDCLRFQAARADAIGQQMADLSAEFDRVKAQASDADGLQFFWDQASAAMKSGLGTEAEVAFGQLVKAMRQAAQPKRTWAKTQLPQARPKADFLADSTEKDPEPALVFVPRELPRERSQFKDLFSQEKLKGLRSEHDKGHLKIRSLEIGPGLGDFRKVLDAAADLSSGKVTDPALLKTVIEHYLSSNKDRDEAKVAKCNEMLLEAKRWQQDTIDDAFPEVGSLNSAVRERAMQGRATAMKASFGLKPVIGGTSVVQLIQDSEGKVAYAFKSVDGETEQSTMAKGGATVREAMSSKVSDVIFARTGYDFGFPKVAVATLEGQQGALIEGLAGESYDVEGLRSASSDGKITPEESYAKQVRCGELAPKVAAAELQKTTLCNIAMANLDVKWGNMMVTASGNTRPFDGGTAFTNDLDMALATGADGTRPRAPDGLTLNPFGGAALSAADDPFDPALLKAFLQIDRDELRQEIVAERARLAQQHGLDPSLLDDAAIARSLSSIEIAQAILGDDTQQHTLSSFCQHYCDSMDILTSAKDVQAVKDVLEKDETLGWERNKQALAKAFKLRRAELG